METSDNIRGDITYFARPGPHNTDETLALAQNRAKNLGLRSVIVASTTGRTGVKSGQIFRGLNLIVVTHSTGFTKPDLQEMTEDNRQKIMAFGCKILTCQHAFGGVGRAVRKKLGTYELEEIVAYALRIFGEGTKVACEMALMASDAGLVRTDEDVISIGGTGSGADTALILQPANAQTFFDLKIREIICKPRL
jgi:hypothetical protein